MVLNIYEKYAAMIFIIIMFRHSLASLKVLYISPIWVGTKCSMPHVELVSAGQGGKRSNTGSSGKDIYSWWIYVLRKK